MLEKRLVCVTGLPRAGSTLLCQLLGHHHGIYSPGHSSPLIQALNQLRSNLSDNHFHLAQFDVDGELVHQRMVHAFRGFMAGWFAETDHRHVVDKNRSWLNQIEMAQLLAPDCRMLVCVREPAQIYGSIEARHQETLLMDFPDHIAHLSPFDRADRLFANEGVIGAPLHAINNLRDRPEAVQHKVYYVVFEHLMAEPVKAMQEIFAWLDLAPVALDPEQLEVRPHESDSYYRGKYPHRTRGRIEAPTRHDVPTRIDQEIRSNFAWFYEQFYPGLG